MQTLQTIEYQTNLKAKQSELSLSQTPFKPFKLPKHSHGWLIVDKYIPHVSI